MLKMLRGEKLFQSTLPVRGATVRTGSAVRLQCNFNPRSPCGERLHGQRQRPRHRTFQSTLPVRGATLQVRSSASFGCYFNPRSPCGERLNAVDQVCDLVHFNPRSPCGERPVFRKAIAARIAFQSTLPVRGATVALKTDHPAYTISIHAPRAGSDDIPEWVKSETKHFNPRSPCGERPQQDISPAYTQPFQSTLPVRGATINPE